MMSYLVVLLEFFLFLRSIHGLNETCSRNSDCSTSQLCINDLCTCDVLSYYSETSSQCLQYATEYNAFCSEQQQCDWLGSHSECSHNRCICAENFRWYKGKCQKYVDKGEECESSDECYNGYDLLSLSCSSGICNCNSGYYDRGPDCRETSSILGGGDCALNLDCPTSLHECTLGKCIKDDDTSNENVLISFDAKVQPRVKILTYEQDELFCEKDSDCRDMANSLCDISNNTCGCNEDTHYLYNGNCVQGLNHCDNDNDCTGNNSICFRNSSCTCQQGFFLNNKQCIAELGMHDPYASYETDSDCPIKPGRLVNSTCYCKNYWFNDEANRNCIKTMIQDTHICLTNEWCAAMGPYSFCNSTSNTCQCSSIAEFNETTYYCHPMSNTKDICLKDSECDINELCVDEKCQCLENFSRNDDNICIPNIGASCATVSCFDIDNLSCVGGICACDNTYIGKENKCLKMADSLDTPCEDQAQCENLEHSVCGESDNGSNDTLRCVCEEGYIDVSKICHQNKKYGDPCMTEVECTIVLNRSYKCRNSICQCAVGQSLKNGYCTSDGNIISLSYLLWLVFLIMLGLC